MSRQAKPYFRKFTKSWYCSIGGKQVSLGKDRKAAFEKFHALMADTSQVREEATTLYELSQVYLDWCEENRTKSTYSKHKYYLELFIGSVGKRMRPAQLKVHHVTKWHEGLGVGSTTQNDAVAVVQRMLNWSVEQEYLSRNPVKGIRKPKRKRRDVFYSPEQWKQIKTHAQEPLTGLLDFLFLTGCRPLEARTLEARHLHGDLAVFPADESKGETEPRVIYLVPEARAVLTPLVERCPTGPLFRNSRGNPWTKDAIRGRLETISRKVGFRVIAYGTRHSFATNALTQGVDSTAVGHLMGHKDTTMVHRVYGHLTKNPDFLREQAQRAIEKRGAP